MIRILQKNLHFSICNFHFSMKFSVSFQKAKLILFSIFFSAIFLILILLLGGCSGGGGDSGGTINLAWDAPTTNVDGSPLTDLAGYKVYVGTAPGTYGTSVNVGNVTTYILSGLTSGQTYYIAVTAYDYDNNESDYSNEVSGPAK